MRATASFGALVAGSLLQHSAAQAAGSGSSIDGLGAQAYGQVANAPQGNPQTAGADFPKDSPHDQSCVMQATSTIFVTVYPTSPVSAGGSVPGSGSDDTVYQTFYPTTQTVQVSPVGSLQATAASVSIFTTITVDIWGTGSSPEQNQGTFASASPSSVDASFPSNVSPPDAIPGYGGGSNTVASNPTATFASVGPNGSPWVSTDAAGPAPASTSTNVGPQGPQGLTAWFTVVTDTDVHWTAGVTGPTPITVLSEHTIAFPGPSGAAGNGGQVTCITTTGPDGRQTIVEWPVGSPTATDNRGQFPPPVTQATSMAVSAPWPGATISNAPGAPAATTYTVIGPDGNPTIIQSGVPATAAYTIIGPDGNPTVVQPGAPAATIYTVVGPDGNPTIIQSGAPSGATYTVIGPDGNPTIVQPGAPEATTYTVIGPNGVPTVVQSSWYVPQAPPTGLVPLPTDVIASGQIQVIPNGAPITSSTSYTFVGPDGRPTVVESTFVLPGPAATQVGAPGYAGNGPVQATVISGLPVPASAASLVPTTYTVIGANGLPSVVDTTYLVPPPATAATNVPGGVVTGVPFQVTPVPQNAQSAGVPEGITTCITYTAIGPDGRPTAVESTVVMPASNGLPSSASLGFPGPVPSQQSNLPQGVSVGSPITTAVSIDVLGPNGVATPVVGTIVLTPAVGAGTALPPVTTIAYPSLAPQRPQTGLPQGQVASVASNVAISTCVTVDVVGSNGVVTPFVQTIVFTPVAMTVGLPTDSPVVFTSGIPQPSAAPIVPGLGDNQGGVPGLNAYGTDAALPPSVVTGVDGKAAPGNGAMTLTVVAGPNGSPVFSEVPIPLENGAGVNGPPAYGSNQAPSGGYGWGPGKPASYGSTAVAAPQPLVAGSNVQTSTWTNVIHEVTTTYKLNFPMTTLVTLAARAQYDNRRRVLRRQASSLSSSAWNNVTSTALPSPDETMPPVPPGPPSAGDGAPAPALCPSGGKVGNITVNFDNFKPGPLLNPSEDMWFSEGFLVAPPSPQQAQSYVPSSGGQLVEFVPSSLSPSNAPGAGDTAQVGLGPNSASPCFRFDFLGANLGCAAQGNEQWCEFEVSAYTYDEALSSEQAVGWSETKRVPACPNFPTGNCPLTPVEFAGYTNITSVLIKLHVGLELRAWWGDDFQFAWTDNSCDAASCRAQALPHRVKRESVMSALRSGVWHWTPEGLQRLDDQYIWESVN